jgi:hypothetical protein
MLFMPIPWSLVDARGAQNAIEVAALSQPLQRIGVPHFQTLPRR